MTTTEAVLLFAYFLTWLLIPWVLLKRRVHESATVAWLIGIVFVPFLGAILCVLVGNMRWERQTKRKRAASREIQRHVARKHPQADSLLRHCETLADLVEEMTRFPVSSGNDIQLLPDTHESLDVLEEMIDSAEDFIHIEFYIWRHDEAGRRIQERLIDKATKGVEVRMLYDGFGSFLMGRRYLKTIQSAGVETAAFTPGLRLWPIDTLHLRNHRKLVVVDGTAGFTGGMNIGNEYLYATKSYGQWRDTQAMIRGPAVLQLQQVFVQDWNYATGTALTNDRYYPEPNHVGTAACQVVPDGPDNDVDVYYCLIVAALGLAQKEVLVSTPYFIPPDGLAVAMQTAARRGVRVKLIVADRGNFLWTKMAGRSYFNELLLAGVEILEYQDGLYHPKTLVVDGQWSLVGTPNCDYRSLFLNFEVAVACFDRHIAEQIERQFESDAKLAKKITLDEWRERSLLKRLHEEFWRLFAPVL